MMVMGLVLETDTVSVVVPVGVQETVKVPETEPETVKVMVPVTEMVMGQ